MDDFNNPEMIEDEHKTKAQLIAELTKLRGEMLILKQSSQFLETTQLRSQRGAETRSPNSAPSGEEIGWLTAKTVPEDPQSYTVLLVDDSEIDRTACRLFLTDDTQKNYDVVEFSNAEDALVWCRTHTPDILLIDYVLPGMSGLDFLSQLRQKVGYEKMPCIIMISQRSQELAIQSFKNGTKDFLNENRMTPEGLNRAITNLLPKVYWVQEQELQRERQHLVNMLSYSIRQSFRLEEIFQYTVTDIRQLLQCDRVLIYQFQADYSGKIINESILDPALSLQGQEFKDTYFTQDAQWLEGFYQGQICNIADIQAEPNRPQDYQEFLNSIQVQAQLVVHILQENNLWGLLIAHHCTAPRHWKTAEIELLNQLAVQIGAAIQAVELNQKAEKERLEREKIEKVINEIATALIAKTGEDFFQLLVNYLCRVLEVDYVCLAELINPEFVKTLAVSYQQQIIDNFEIDIRYQPCSDILKADPNTVKSYPNHAKELFADHRLIQSANIQAYLGIPLVDLSQKAIGLLTVLHCSSIENYRFAEEVLKIFAGRVGAELERQQIEARLRKSEADLLEAQHIAHVGHWKWDKLTDEIWLSKELYRICGIPFREKITLTFFVECIHPDDRERVLQEIRAAFQGQRYKTIYRIYRPDGKLRFLKVIGEVIFDASGNAEKIRGVALDITELKEAELELQTLNIGLEERVRERTAELTRLYWRLQQEIQERQQMETEKLKSETFYSHFLEQELIEREQIEQQLRESETRYRQIVETASEGIWQLDEQDKTVFVNPRMAEMLGYSIEEILGKLILDFVEETEKEAIKYLMDHRENSLIKQYDIQFCRKNGSTLWAMISSRPIVDEFGQYLGRLKMVTDISDRKQAEENLRQSQMLLETLASRIPGTLYSLVEHPDHSVSFEYLSSGSRELLEYEAEQLMANPSLYLEAIHPDDQAQRQVILDKAFEKKEFFCEWRMITPSGHCKWVQASSRLEQRLDKNIWHGVLLDITSRKQAEAKLQEQEAFLRAVGDNIPKGVLYQLARELDGSYRVIYISAGVERDTIHKVEEIYQDSKLLFSFVIEQDRPLLLQKYEESFENLSIFDLQVRAQYSPEEGIRWVRLCASPRRLADGRTIWDGIRLDITELKQSEEKFRQLAETIQDVFYLYKGNFQELLYASPTYENMWQLSRESLALDNMSFLSRLHPEDRDRVVTQMQGFVQNKTDFREEYRLLLPDGSIRWIYDRCFFIYNDAGEPYRIAGLASDISDRKQVEAEVKEFSRRWRLVLDNIPMIVVQLDKDFDVEYINPFFQKISQFATKEVLGKNWVKNFVPHHLNTDLNTILEEILQNEVHTYYENPIVIKSGEERMIAWRNSLLKDNKGQPIGIISIGEDITEQYRLERMKSEFISIVSHELKTPLTAIQASLSLLSDKIIDPVSEEGEETIAIATEGIDRLVRLVNDILDLERLQSGKIMLKKSYCDIQDIITSAIAQIQELLKQSNIEIKVSSAAFALYADSDRIIQVLINLLSNAIKFSLPHSTIDLSVKYQTPESFPQLNTQPQVLFMIRDQGRGIPPQNLETIFERFQQVDASDSREKGGTGLGLAICRDIVEQHGGKIAVESILGEGSTFYVTIPTKSPEALNHD